MRAAKLIVRTVLASINWLLHTGTSCSACASLPGNAFSYTFVVVTVAYYKHVGHETPTCLQSFKLPSKVLRASQVQNILL